MTRPAKSALVLDGNEIKVRLEAERASSRSVVHVDWVRFTCLLRNAPAPDVDTLFPLPAVSWADELDTQDRRERIAKILRDLPDAEFAASAQALDLAREVAQAMGPDFTVAEEIRKGHDFYRFRWSIERNGSECGWVGYLSSGDSPRQNAQSKTIHCNLYGAACTFAEHGWNHRIASIVDTRHGDITRADLALDFFDGVPGWGDPMKRIEADYLAGVLDSGGKRLVVNCVGDWINGKERSFYAGSKEAGKQTNAYEKGQQLFGRDSGSAWIRFELRYGNKLRVLSSDILRRPADFFAGASDWHTSLLLLADQIPEPEKVKTTARLALETVEAEVSRNIRWARNVAAPTIAAAWDHLGDDFLELVTNQKLPGRLQRFSRKELGRAFGAAFHRFHPVAGTGLAMQT